MSPFGLDVGLEDAFDPEGITPPWLLRPPPPPTDPDAHRAWVAEGMGMVRLRESLEATAAAQRDRGRPARSVRDEAIARLRAEYTRMAMAPTPGAELAAESIVAFAQRALRRAIRNAYGAAAEASLYGGDRGRPGCPDLAGS